MATIALNPPLFPPFVGQHSLQLAPEDGPELPLFAGLTRPPALARAVPSRQLEFLAGRLCVREALRVCAPGLAGADVGVGPQREPLWPPGIVGAITHAAGFVSAAVARRREAGGLGLDVETIMDDAKAASVLATIADAEELAALERATGWPGSAVLTLIFSAKESLFKALFPQVGRYFEFLDAAIIAIDRRGTFTAELRTALTPALPAGYVIEGRFRRDDTSVTTALVLPP